MSTDKQLQVAVVGGLGRMASPMARHWKDSQAIKVLRVHDRGSKGEYKDKCRKLWQENGATLVNNFKDLVGQKDLNGVFVCCGKNGDDLSVIAQLANLLETNGLDNSFICHMSTVSTSFVKAAYEFCRGKKIRYVNYPLTGGPIGAENASMLILASGDIELYNQLKDALSLISKPKHLGASITAGAEIKLMGHLMVFNGLVGICSAAAVHTASLNHGQLGGTEQVEFFDFLNNGAGGTKQWDVILKHGLKDDCWNIPFQIRHAVVDAIYTAQMCIDYGVSYLAIQPIINIILAFSYLANKVDINLATHAIVREMIASHSKSLDQFIIEHSVPTGNAKLSLEKCIQSLPDDIKKTVALNITTSDFK